MDRERKRLENNNIENLSLEQKSLKIASDIRLFSLGRYYWGNIGNFEAYIKCYDDNGIFIGQDIPSIGLDAQFSYNNDGLISFEEVRTILGSISVVEGYQEGDDLCENLYRISCNKKIRWGHLAYNKVHSKNKKYYPDETVLQRALRTTYTNYEIYKINDL